MKYDSEKTVPKLDDTPSLLVTWTRVGARSKASPALRRPWFPLRVPSSDLLTLGQRAMLSRTRVSRIVDEPVATGLAERQPHPTGRRSSFATLTAVGREALREALRERG